MAYPVDYFATTTYIRGRSKKKKKMTSFVQKEILFLFTLSASVCMTSIADQGTFCMSAMCFSPKLPCLRSVDESVWQMGQHSPSGTTTFSQLVSSSQWISSQRTWPLSHTQMRHGSGFQMSLLVYTWPSAVQLKSSPVTRRGRREALRFSWRWYSDLLSFFLFFFLLFFFCSNSAVPNESLPLL